MAEQIRRTVVQRKNDPYIYLYVMGEWYCYNPSEPPLGSGAMGDVYRGYRCKNSSYIAVKRVKDCYANMPMIRERARQEASLAFRHPNLVEMIGYSEVAPDNGPIFLLSHYVQGEEIDKYVSFLNDSPNRVEKIAKAMCSVLDALDYIHSRGVIHRDIKPSNIMVENGSNVRLMDLGISRMNGGNKYSTVGFIGTPQYSAPEQIKRNEGWSINATTDFYELGITFYELLTGVNPFDSSSEAETLEKQLKDKLPSNSIIPDKLMRVIWKATEKDQSKRFQFASEFKKAIEDAFIPDPSTFEKMKLWIENNIFTLVIAMVVLFAFIFVVIIISV